MHLRSIALLALCASTVLSLGLSQQAAPEKDLSGNWILAADLFGTTVYLHMELKQDGEKLSGKYTGDKVTTGTVSGGAIHLLATSDDGTTSDVNATLKDGVISGNALETDPHDKDHPSKYTFTATRLVASR
jgi:amidase